MTWKIAFWSLMLSALSLLVTSGAALADDFPLDIEYQFPEVDPVKIYAGSVTFSHETHIADYKISCVRCHHTLKPGDTQVTARCRSCHVKEGFPRFEAAAGLSEKEKKEHYLVVLHKRCIDCHIETKLELEQNRPPISCTRCHLAETP